jgi:ABC-type uncharacterized transport system auxiliary subunit
MPGWKRQFATPLGIATLATIILLLGGCGAARPVKYYTLNPEPVPMASSMSNAPLQVSILVGPLESSHLYRDDRIVYGNGGVDLGTYESNRWSDNPTEMVESMLVQTLRSKGEFRSVARLRSSARGDYILRGHLFSLEEVDAPSLVARFAISLELFEVKTGRVVWAQTYSHDEPVGQKTVTTVVEALRTNVSAGLDQLSTSLVQYFAEHPQH